MAVLPADPAAHDSRSIHLVRSRHISAWNLLTSFL